MSCGWKRVTKQAAAFGAAMAALGGAEVAEGAVVSLTPNPGSQPFYGYGSGGTVVSLGSGSLSFYQFNDSIGRSLYGVGSITGLRSTTYGNTITSGLSFSGGLGRGTSTTGTETFAFRTNSNQLGWIRMSFGGSGGAITYLAAAFETSPGTPIIAGGGAVPEPGTAALLGLGLLALGAAGVKRVRRKKPESAS